MTDQYEPLERKIRELLDTSLQDIDDDTLVKLRRARESALAQGKQQGIVLPWLRWGIFPLALMVALLFLNPWRSGQPELQLVIPDVTLLVIADSIDFFNEELEFYQWLLETKEHVEEEYRVPHPDASVGPSPSTYGRIG